MLFTQKADCIPANFFIVFRCVEDFFGGGAGWLEEVSVCVWGVRVRTNGARSGGREGGGRGEGGGNKGRQAALAAQWEDYPMPGLVAAAAAGWTGGSALWRSSSSSRSPFLYHRQKSTDKEAEDRQHRVQAGTFKNKKKKKGREKKWARLQIPAVEKEKKKQWASQPAWSLCDGLTALRAGL